MSLKNPYGDFEITEPQALRALAHPVRLAILEHLQRQGPATATGLSPHVGATPSVVSWHLRHLATFGLVHDWDGATSKRERWWQAVARGFRFTAPEGTEGQSAVQQLRAEMFARNADAPQQWLLHEEPRLHPEWRALAGMADTRFVATAAELRQLEESIEELIAPYVRRKEESAPADARIVRMLRYLLPEPADEAPAEPSDDDAATS
ncbi:helix-turn-helix domain-containing protein [Micromonospora sp. NBC_00362]|uniref:ArsR/SmtB family transcription factor n=1 Tax=Micromonospora sp. NBC_00362 TaxID=2975975 RepID=UPI002252F663|nr:helix-turn-helix domain-containing protein [Micromonospora sp. NBC_00362]MCX5117049.1 helix-turn-helix domain-containing protein [Micromonospora sp. NBC_00362]